MSAELMPNGNFTSVRNKFVTGAISPNLMSTKPTTERERPVFAKINRRNASIVELSRPSAPNSFSASKANIIAKRNLSLSQIEIRNDHKSIENGRGSTQLPKLASSTFLQPVSRRGSVTRAETTTLKKDQSGYGLRDYLSTAKKQKPLNMGTMLLESADDGQSVSSIQQDHHTIMSQSRMSPKITTQRQQDYATLPNRQ